VVRTTIESTLERYEEDLTRVEVYLRDENGDKPGPHDLSCRLEARPKGHQPLSVSAKGDTLEQAIDSAATKLDHALEHLFGRLQGKPRAAAKNQPINKVNEDALEQEFLENENAVING
jgi:ribosome-associated translation inhibitor RaiA